MKRSVIKLKSGFEAAKILISFLHFAHEGVFNHDGIHYSQRDENSLTEYLLGYRLIFHQPTRVKNSQFTEHAWVLWRSLSRRWRTNKEEHVFFTYILYRFPIFTDFLVLIKNDWNMRLCRKLSQRTRDEGKFLCVPN